MSDEWVAYLDLQLALPEAKWLHLGNVVLHPCFTDNILTGDAEVDITLSDEGRDVGCG